MKSLEGYIVERLEKHLNIEYKLFENAGLYDGIEDLARFLTNKIKSHQEKEFKLIYKDNNIGISKFKNIFFKSIILNCERSNGYDNEGRYVINGEIDYDANTNKLNYVLISLELSIKHEPEDVYFILIHELTHAWDNFNHIKRYSKPYSKSKTGQIYNRFTNSMDEGELIGKILYFINDIEINAWVASFAGYLYDYIEDNTIDNPHKALEIIKNSPLYKNYINIGEYVTAMYNNDNNYISKEFMHNCCKEYNKIYGKNYTEEKVRKQLYIQYKKAMQKIESNIGKLCTRYVKNLSFKDKNPKTIQI